MLPLIHRKNSSISSYEHVPLLGDLMISRWAYEAMAVKQFRDNEYQKNFYYLEKKKSEASYIASYLIPALNNKISKIQYNNTKEQKIRNIRILRKEIATELVPKLYSVAFSDGLPPKAAEYAEAIIGTLESFEVA